MTPLSKPVAATPASAQLSFEFDAESWVQFHDAEGELLEKGLMKAGDSRQFNSGELGRVVLGNASQVRVMRAGAPVDISPWLRSNVARFTVSSDGSFAEGE